MTFLSEDLWLKVNRQLVAKCIRELHYEEAFCLEESSSCHDTNTINKGSRSNRHPDAGLDEKTDGSAQEYALYGDKHCWRFSASLSIWGMLLIDASSIRCDGKKDVMVCDWLLDMRSELAMGDLTLSGLLEEIQQTLYSDMQVFEFKKGITAFDLVKMPEIHRQRYLDGHPKAIANRGRLGWGCEELARFAPEAGQPTALHLLAVKRALTISGWTASLTEKDFWRAQLSEENWLNLNNQLPEGGWETFTVMAVHPWQLHRYLYSQYAKWFAEGHIVDMGAIGGEWLPQTSLRTLSSADASCPYDTKTAITVLNTSCYRGIPGRYITHGAALSTWLNELVVGDSLLASRNLRVQQEVAGIFCPHPYQQRLTSGAYRYQEMLGCVWRESADSCVSSNEQCLSLATLLEVDQQGKSCLAVLIELSGQSAQAWLRDLFRHVAVPLYHLLCRFGVAVIPHGQNVTLILENHRPIGCLIKDFHGDLRLIDQPFFELQSLEEEVKSVITHLPAKYLVHDLYTGHFASVMRFISPILQQESEAFYVSEDDFYLWLSEEIHRYQIDQIEQSPDMAERFKLFDILSPTMEKVCINRVRFQQGYADTTERPVPILGTPLRNPLVKK